MSTLKTGKVKTTTIADELDTESTAVTNVINGSAKAWVTWNAVGGGIGASFNVSSVTDSGTGVSTINFVNAFDDIYYTVVCGGNQFTDAAMRWIGPSGTSGHKGTSSVIIYTGYYSGTSSALYDYNNYSHSVVCLR
jgi:hypothetical protein